MINNGIIIYTDMEEFDVELIRISDVQKTYKTGTVALYDLNLSIKKGEFVFVIGGSLGLHESVVKRADEKFSFSDLTFPHQLLRVILLEQIYRCYRIINGEPYHK